MSSILIIRCRCHWTSRMSACVILWMLKCTTFLLSKNVNYFSKFVIRLKSCMSRMVVGLVICRKNWIQMIVIILIGPNEAAGWWFWELKIWLSLLGNKDLEAIKVRKPAHVFLCRQLTFWKKLKLESNDWKRGWITI